MLLKIIGRVLATLATILVFGILRLVVLATMPHPHPHPHPRAQAGASATADQGTGTLAAADHSGWIVFDTADPATGLRTRHARLTGSGQSMLELTRSGTDQHAVVSLPPQPACPAITALPSEFDKHTAQLAVKAQSGPTCRLEIRDYAAALQSLRDSDMLTIHPTPHSAITFAVGGLAWD